MRRAAALSSALALLGLGAAPHPASAGATVDLLFVRHNGVPILPTAIVEVAPDPLPGYRTGDTLTMAIVMKNDQPLTVAVFSLDYDVLDGDEDLSAVQAFQWAGVAINKQASDFFVPLGALGSGATFVGSFQGLTTNPSPRMLPAAGGAFAGGYQMGTVVWKVTAACSRAYRSWRESWNPASTSSGTARSTR